MAKKDGLEIRMLYYFGGFFLNLTNDPSPEEKTVQFKGRVEKDVEIRIDRFLANNVFKIPYTYCLKKRGYLFL